MPIDPPSTSTASDVRGDVGHAGVQRPVDLARGRQPALRVQYERPDRVRVARRLHVRVEGRRAAARLGRPLLQRQVLAAADPDPGAGYGLQEGADY